MTKQIEIPASMFDFSGNYLCLDFVNTLQDRFSTPGELLNRYDDLVQWGQEADILSEDEAVQLRAEATRHPDEAGSVRQQAITLREAIYRIFYARLHDVSPEESDLATLNAMLARAMTKASIHSSGNGFAWDWNSDDIELERIYWPIVRSAAELLTAEELESVRMCAAEDCGWLFLDTSKNHTRRWCDMKSCGNRAKARKHYKKAQA
jgi:predicted RNA-binding Zn ribbon-like protein